MTEGTSPRGRGGTAAARPPPRADPAIPARRDGITFGSSAPAALAATRPSKWIINAHAITLLRGAGAGNALLTKAFGGSHAYVSGTPDGFGLPTATYDSYPAVQSAFASGALPGKYRAVLLDLEHWSFTPAAEQTNPAKYERLTAALVHAHNMLLITAPAVDIVKARCTCSTAAAQRSHYLSLNIAAGAARYANAIDIQAQNDERSLASYRAFVSAAAKQARAANQSVLVLAGLSTDNGATRVTGAQLFAAYQAVRSLVSGYWLNIPAKSAQCPACAGPFPGPALTLLHKIYG